MSKAISPLAAEPKVATVNETCDLLRVSRGTIHKLVKTGRLRSSTIGTRRLIFRDSIDSLLNEAAA